MAVDLVNQPRDGRGRKKVRDPLVAAAAKYIKLKNSGVSSSKLAFEHPEIYEVDSIYENTAVTLRWSLEALVIGGETRENIAEYLGTSPEVVRLYESFFYDVRDRSKGFILHGLLGNTITHLNQDDPRVYWKVLALTGGHQLLYQFWEYGTLPEPALKRMREIARSTNTKNAMIAAQTMRFNSETSVAMANLLLEERKLELALAQGGVVDDSADRAKKMVETMVISIAEIGHPVRSVTSETKHIEPRAGDLLKRQLLQLNINEESPTPPELPSGEAQEPQ